jgi:hypothetical protein
MSTELDREKFLNLHMDELQKQIWLLELDLAIIENAVLHINKKEDIDKAIQQQNGIRNQIMGMTNRKSFIMKVINGTIKLEEKPEK